MDWDLVIERNAEALRRVLAMLVAMAGLSDCWIPTTPHCRLPIADRPTLPRRLHNAVLRLLRPAESAARRLVIVAARGLAITVPPPRPRKRKPDPKAAHAALRGLGIAIVLPPARTGRAAGTVTTSARPAGRVPLLPLFDPPRHPLRRQVRTVPPHAAPRILTFDGAVPHRLPPSPSPHDLVDATRLARRLEALTRALDDLPGHARRFARWKARREQARLPATPYPPLHSGGGAEHMRGGGGIARVPSRRISPLRSGRPPGQRSRHARGRPHEVHDILTDLHHFATLALEAPDTS